MSLCSNQKGFTLQRLSLNLNLHTQRTGCSNNPLRDGTESEIVRAIAGIGDSRTASQHHIPIEILRNNQIAHNLPHLQRGFNLLQITVATLHFHLRGGIHHPDQCAAQFTAIQIQHRYFLLLRHLFHIGLRIDDGIDQRTAHQAKQDGKTADNRA